MKKSIIISAVMASLCLIPTSSFANYYGYERCVNNGGGYFGCLGELADGMAMSPHDKEVLAAALERDPEATMKNLKMKDAKCSELKGAQQMNCYVGSLSKTIEAKPARAILKQAPLKREAISK